MHWHVCTKCHEEKSSIADHRWDEGVVTKEPTYTELGEITYTCDDCKYKKYDDIPMLIKDPEPSEPDDSSDDNSDSSDSSYDSDNHSNDSNPGNVTNNPQTGIVISLFPMAAAITAVTAAVKRKKK